MGTTAPPVSDHNAAPINNKKINKQKNTISIMKFQIQMEGEFVKCAMFWRNIKFDLEGQIYVGLR